MNSSQSRLFNSFPDYPEDSSLNINIAKEYSIKIIDFLIQNGIPFSCFQDNNVFVKYEKDLEGKKDVLASDKDSFIRKPLKEGSDLEAAIKVIHQQITADISAELPSIETITSALNISPAIFKAIFKRMYGLPFHKYCIKYKMEQAKQLLESGKYSVTQLSEALGYTTPTKFVVVFKKYQNITPGKIKALAKAQPK
ncbi:hypothetical protein DR864_23425 [Runella rosea]|uniref:HTH araC/xylS-type domain-containing protein n=1 Tax=Runella rosea TaxID=2259595 RepID=A0A344TPA6_9BACT|nr:AraC family transcriptional regulator [Runella rosea]AXE20477.1 hypothetical protein DR864_23425 [Runella rosea]